MACACEPNNNVDLFKIANRYGLGGVSVTNITPDGAVTMIKCDTVNKIDEYLYSECDTLLERSEMDLFLRFVAYADGGIVTDDVSALDTVLADMVEQGKDCLTLQGGNCG